MRQPAHPIESLFVERWSGRSMTGEAVSQDEMLRLFEAARWAPSSANQQPWRFLYATREHPDFARFLACLVESNAVWAKNAGAFVLVMSRLANDAGKPIGTHAFDTGAAWMSLALQGSRMGLVVHAMGGFDAEKARADLAVPEGLALHCMVAVGRPAPVDALPEPLRARETPNARNPVETFVEQGAFPSRWRA